MAKSLTGGNPKKPRKIRTNSSVPGILKPYTDKQSANSDYASGSGPRVGGVSKPNPTAHKLSGTSSNKLIKQSIKSIKKSAASPQAKRSALASYKKK